MEQFTIFFEKMVDAYWSDLLWIGGLFIAGRVFFQLLAEFVRKYARGGKAGLEKRAVTLASLVSALGNIIIYTIIILLSLRMFGVDLKPILTGAGIAGLAIGFGSQSLVKDFVTGLLILVEAQYSIGDRVQIGSAEGKVIKVTVRSTVLRDDQGRIYYIPNGSITSVINLTYVNKEN